MYTPGIFRNRTWLLNSNSDPDPSLSLAPNSNSEQVVASKGSVIGLLELPLLVNIGSEHRMDGARAARAARGQGASGEQRVVIHSCI